MSNYYERLECIPSFMERIGLQDSTWGLWFTGIWLSKYSNFVISFLVIEYPNLHIIATACPS
jgi:hypothetical protein